MFNVFKRVKEGKGKKEEDRLLTLFNRDYYTSNRKRKYFCKEI